MVDREKVIKGLEICTADIPIENGMHRDDMCQKCPYHNEKYAYCFEKNKLMQDALALLKEQEPVAPVMVPHSRGIAYNCGACGTEIAVIKDTVSAGWAKENVRYCQRCGRAVKWE